MLMNEDSKDSKHQNTRCQHFGSNFELRDFELHGHVNLFHKEKNIFYKPNNKSSK